MLDGETKGLEVDLSKSTLRDDRVLREALKLLLVADEVFDRAGDTFRLYAVDVGASEHPTDERRLGVGFETPSAQRGALDVDGLYGDGVSNA